jgi:hypothetical protein
VVRAWFWLAAHTDDLAWKWRCPEANIDLEPDNEPAGVALQRLLRWQERADQGGCDG